MVKKNRCLWRGDTQRYSVVKWNSYDVFASSPFFQTNDEIEWCNSLNLADDLNCRHKPHYRKSHLKFLTSYQRNLVATARIDDSMKEKHKLVLFGLPNVSLKFRKCGSFLTVFHFLNYICHWTSLYANWRFFNVDNAVAFEWHQIRWLSQIQCSPSKWHVSMRMQTTKHTQCQQKYS